MSEWISVNDFLPPFNTHVILFMPKIENMPEVNIGYLERDGDFYFNETQENIDVDTLGLVTHWMPIPELPNE